MSRRVKAPSYVDSSGPTSYGAWILFGWAVASVLARLVLTGKVPWLR